SVASAFRKTLIGHARECGQSLGAATAPIRAFQFASHEQAVVAGSFKRLGEEKMMRKVLPIVLGLWLLHGCGSGSSLPPVIFTGTVANQPYAQTFVDRVGYPIE